MTTLARLRRLRVLERESADRAARMHAQIRHRAEQALARIDVLITSGAQACDGQDRTGLDFAAGAHARDRLESARATLVLAAAQAARQASDAEADSRMARVRQDVVISALDARARAARAWADTRALESMPKVARMLHGAGMASGPLES